VLDRLNVASRWRWAVLLAVLICAFALAHPMTAHAARTLARSAPTRASGAIYYPTCSGCRPTLIAVRRHLLIFANDSKPDASGASLLSRGSESFARTQPIHA
jgi:hypothetical protein